MSNSKISALTSATTPLAGTELVPLVQSGVTKKLTGDNMSLPFLPQDKANHVVYGAVIALVAYAGLLPAWIG